MKVNIDRLQAQWSPGHLEGFDHTLVAIERTGPAIGVNVLVLHRCIDLVVVALHDAQRCHQRERRLCLRDGGQATVHVQQAGLIGQAHRCGQRLAVAAPKDDSGFLGGICNTRRRGGQPVNVVQRADNFTRCVVAVAGNLQSHHPARDVQTQLGVSPVERVAVGVAGHFDMWQGKNFARDLFQERRQRRVQAAWRHFALNDRHRGGPSVALQKFLEHDLGRQGRARQLGPARKTVTIHMDHQQAPARFCGDVGHWNVAIDFKRGAEKFNRIDRPAPAQVLRQVHLEITVRRKPAPRRDGNHIGVAV